MFLGKKYRLVQFVLLILHVNSVFSSFRGNEQFNTALFQLEKIYLKDLRKSFANEND